MFGHMMMVPIAPSTREGELINLTGHTLISFFSTGPGLRECGFIVRSDGKLDLFNVSDTAPPPNDPVNEWVVAWPNGTYAADYECRVVQNARSGGGIETGSPSGNWIDCGTADSNREYGLSTAVAVIANWTLTLSIRHKISLIQYDSATISLNLNNLN